MNLVLYVLAPLTYLRIYPYFIVVHVTSNACIRSLV